MFYKYLLFGALGITLSACQTTSSSTVSSASGANATISNVSVEPLSLKHVCTALSGQGKMPAITISHNQVEGAPITVRMYDSLNDGRVIEHYSTSVASNKSGKTSVSYQFLPPCNTTRRTISAYYFEVTSGSSTKTVLFGKYDSTTQRIFR